VAGDHVDQGNLENHGTQHATTDQPMRLAS
jgi:hypothetical protein